MKILFVCMSGVKFDVETPSKEPLGGTESAVAYLSMALSAIGHDVYIMAATEEKTINGVKHIPLSEEATGTLNPDVVIIPSGPQAVPGVQKVLPNAKVILWNHMQLDQPAIHPLFDAGIRSHIKNIVYVSEGQKKVFAFEGTVINNGISPFFENMFSSPQEIMDTKTCRGAYSSTPYRGLSILASIKDIQIEVYSSMAVYQADDKPYETMFECLKRNECIELCGSVSQKELAERFKRISFFVYPCIFQECHSIAVLEAMAAGLRVVTTDKAHEQTEFVDSLPFVGCSVEEFAKLLRKNMNYSRTHPKEWAERAFRQVQYINQNFTWAKKAAEWDEYLQKLA